jgi:hypothetical protein
MITQNCSKRCQEPFFHTWHLLRQFEQVGFFDTFEIQISHADRDGMITRIEIDDRLLGQSSVTPGWQSEQTAKRGYGSRGQACQLGNFFTAGETQAAKSGFATHLSTRQTPIGRQDEHQELAVRFAHQRFSTTG